VLNNGGNIHTDDGTVLYCMARMEVAVQYSRLVCWTIR
jgi:hypothetical protein